MMKPIHLETNELGSRLATQEYVHEYVHEAIQEAHEQSDKRYWKRDENLFPKRGNGYQKLPSGLILQWGVAIVKVQSSEGDILSNEVAFPISFPNEVLNIQCTEDATNGKVYACNFFFYRKIDSTKFLVRADWTWKHYPTISCSWLALGY